MEPARCGREAKKWIARLVSFARHARIDQDAAIDGIERRHARRRHDAGFSFGEKATQAAEHAPFRPMRSSLRNFRVPQIRIDLVRRTEPDR
jgi:hypothetical protein